MKKFIREQLELFGINTLSTAELLATLTGDKNALSCIEKLLNQFTLSELQAADWPELTTAGLSKLQAQKIKIACELARRLSAAAPDQTEVIKTASDAARIFKPMMQNLTHEEMRILLLDTRNHIVANVLAYSGTVNSSVLRAAEIFKPALVRNCPSVIIAHNHPSNDPSPSPEDIEVTNQLVAAGNLLDIDVLDHLIIGNPSFTSLKQHIAW